MDRKRKHSMTIPREIHYGFVEKKKGTRDANTLLQVFVPKSPDKEIIPCFIDYVKKFNGEVRSYFKKLKYRQ